MPKQYIEIAVALIVVLASIWGVSDALNYPGESGYVPVAVLFFSILLAVVWIGQSFFSLRRRPEKLAVQRHEAKRFLLFSATAILYAICFGTIGFYSSTLLLIPFAAAILGYRHWKVSIPTAVVFLVVLNIVFNLLLKTPLPPELIFSLKGLL